MTLVAVVAVLIATACGAGGGGPKHIDLAFMYADTGANALQEMAYGAQAAGGNSPNVSLTSSAPVGAVPDGPKEVNLFQSATQTSRDGIAVETLTPALFRRPMQQAHSSGIPMVAVDTPPPAGTGVTTFIGNSNTQLGEDMARQMLNRIPADATGQIVIGNQIPGLSVLDQRVQGMEKVFKQERPHVSIVGPFNAQLSPTDNYNAWNAEVQQYPHALAYLCPDDQCAVSLARVEKDTGLRLLVGSCDLDPEAMQGVKEGLVYALASPEHWLKGYIGMKLLIAHAQNGKALPEGWWNPGDLMVTSRNIDRILARQKSAKTRAQYLTKVGDAQLADPSKYIKPMSQAD